MLLNFVFLREKYRFLISLNLFFINIECFFKIIWAIHRIN